MRENVRRNALDDLIRIWPVALSDKTGTARFSFAEPATCNQGMGSLLNRRNEVVGVATDVETWSLYDFVREKNIGRVDLMKIDIQGAEWLLLETGKRFFSDIGPDLLIAISDSDLKCIGRSGRELCLLLESYGYRLHELRGARVEAATLPQEFTTGNLLCTKKER